MEEKSGGQGETPRTSRRRLIQDTGDLDDAGVPEECGVLQTQGVGFRIVEQ